MIGITIPFRRFNASTFSQEWLLTNRIGGYAMGTLAGINMRRYHGLLVAASSPPVGRVVALHNVVDEIEIEGHTIALCSQHFGEEPIVHPDGARHIEDVQVELPDEVRWRFALEGCEVTRTLRLMGGRNCAILSYEIRGRSRAILRVQPLVAMRDFHALNWPGDRPPMTVEHTERSMLVRRGDLGLEIGLGSQTTRRWCSLLPAGDWWRDFAYLRDRERGQEWREDLFTPGRFEHELSEECPRAELVAELTSPRPFAMSPAPPPNGQGGDSLSTLGERRALAAAGSQFVVHRRVGDLDSTSVIAGYPWFADWGRDTMICIPGLLLASGRHEEAERCLITFARHMRRGLIPNRFDDDGTSAGVAHFNTVDASLWFIHAAAQLLARNPLAATREELIEACRAIIRAYRAGTEFNIRMDEADALIAAGDETTQLTWMDAQRDGVTFTPRHGKAIEINALWHHALHALASMTERAKEAEELGSLAKRAARSIQRLFWCEKTRCCYDVLTPDGDDWIGDEAIRPNQVFAVSLEPSPFGLVRQKSIVRVIREKLLTPYGLRTLDPAHPMYRGRFEGDLFARDRAYHQGTVWPWLIGPYCEAVLRANRFSMRAKREVAAAIRPLLDEPGAADAGGEGRCAGQIAEVFDGDSPHRPGGCPAQAWSVAEVLRVVEMLERT